jgi:Protein of unknown function (DUF2470)
MATIQPDAKNISEETSTRICIHMNDDHMVSVFAMAKRKVEFPQGKGWKISNVILKTVTMVGAEMLVTLCRGDACQQVTVTYPFVPPLTEPNQIRSRLIAIHHQVCSPFSCYDHSLFPSVVVFFIATAWYALGPGKVNSDPTLAKGMNDCFYLILFGHTGMAIFGTYFCISVLKLTRQGALKWFIAIFLSGWLGLRELLELTAVDEKSKSTKLEKTS